MTTYTTRALAEKLLPAKTEENPKAATRELRKFLRDELGQGKAVVGKGQRYALDYNAKEITALKKKFSAWQVAQAEAQQARRDALAVKLTPSAPIQGAEDEAIDEAPETTPEDDDATPEGPSDAEIAAMLSDEEELDLDA